MIVTVQVVEDIEVEERYVLGGDGGSGGRGREYKVAMRFADPAKYPPEANITYEEVPPLPTATLYSLPSATYLIATSMHKGHLQAVEPSRHLRVTPAVVKGGGCIARQCKALFVASHFCILVDSEHMKLLAGGGSIPGAVPE